MTVLEPFYPTFVGVLYESPHSVEPELPISVLTRDVDELHVHPLRPDRCVERRCERREKQRVLPVLGHVAYVFVKYRVELVAV